MAYATKRHKAFAPDGTEYFSVWEDWVSYSSPRGPDGQLRLQPQTFMLTKNYARCQMMLYPPELTRGIPPMGANVMNLPEFPAALEQRARDRAYARLRGQDALLGVTIGTMNQTAAMISSKATGLAERTEQMARQLERARKRGQLVKRNPRLANAWLEYFYGWKPFFQDMHASLQTVSSLTPEAIWVSGRANAPVNQRHVSGTDPERTLVYIGHQSAVYSFRSEVTNPNTWMANRLGIINPGTVAWDLVPWSFVVNMFVNVNSLIGSVSEDVGISNSGHSLTKTTRLSRVVTDRSKNSKSVTSTVTDMTDKRRTLGAISVRPVFKTPELNWELAITASALLMQKVNKLNTVADRLYRGWAYRHTYTE